MMISASQLKTFTRCQRLWWFEKVREMPGRGSSYGATFGSVLHAVLERWLKADETGRSPDGNPVDLYPTNWQYTDDGLRIEEEHEQTIKGLVQGAADKGILQRRPGREVEKHFVLPVVDGVDIQGYIDLALPGEVQDHKSTGNMRYALSKAKLAGDLQMNVYAYALDCEQGYEEYVLRHNVFERSGKMRVTEVQVSREVVLEHWELVKALANSMVSVRDCGLDDENYQALNDGMPEACNAYGGCRFIPICTGRETPEHFRKRYKRLNTVTLPTIKPPKAEPNPDPTTLTLLRGVLVQQGALLGNGVSISVLLRQLVESTDSTLASYYQKNAFERRDLLKVVAGDWAGGLKSSVVVFCPLRPDPDENSLISAITPFASLVLVASA